MGLALGESSELKDLIFAGASGPVAAFAARLTILWLLLLAVMVVRLFVVGLWLLRR